MGSGSSPGERLQDLERAILAHDPALDGPAPPHGTGPARARRSGPERSSWRGERCCSSPRSPRPWSALSAGGAARRLTAAANSVAVIDPHTDRVVADTSVGVAPGDVAAGVGGVWVVNTDDHTLSNIDPASRRVVSVVPVGGNVDALAADAGALWTVDSTRGVASRIDPTFGSVIRSVAVGDKFEFWQLATNPIAVGDGAVWVANNASGVKRIPDRGASVPLIGVGNDPSAIAVGLGAAWVADDADGTVSRIDPTHGVLQPSGRAGGKRDRRRRRGGLGRQHARQHPRADRPRHQLGDDHHHRRQPTRGASRSGTGRCGWPTAATEPSRAWSPRTHRVIATIPVGSEPAGPGRQPGGRVGQRRAQPGRLALIAPGLRAGVLRMCARVRSFDRPTRRAAWPPG